MYCPYCGKPVSEGGNYCANCGKQITGDPGQNTPTAGNRSSKAAVAQLKLQVAKLTHFDFLLFGMQMLAVIIALFFPHCWGVFFRLVIKICLPVFICHNYAIRTARILRVQYVKLSLIFRKSSVKLPLLLRQSLVMLSRTFLL